MCIRKCLLFLLFASIIKGNVIERLVTTASVLNVNQINSSFEQTFIENATETIVPPSNSSSIIPENETTNDAAAPIYDNAYADKLHQASDIKTEEFHSGPQYEANWTFTDKETVHAVFSLFSLSESINEKRKSYLNDNRVKLYPTMLSVPSRTIQSIFLLKYFRFTIRQYKTDMKKVLPIEPLMIKPPPPSIGEFYSNKLILRRLNPKETYSICIYYYQSNVSIQMPDLFICQDLLHDHSKAPERGVIFILTQYSIIIGFLVILQTLFSIKKRRLAHILHQHLVNKAQKLRSTLSSVSLVRQSLNLSDTIADQKHIRTNGHVYPEKNILKKRIISSPAIVLNEPSIPLNKSINNPDENEPFLKLATGKNHVHFLLGLDEESENDDDNETTPDDITLNPPLASRLSEPYGDNCDAILSMAHILESNKPWSRQS
ncbi:unnamed protein product [Rotaria socialis]|uniref:Uncharacterized protein n=3 Tax=Rotaria socialis TaxID=392032 RepID=A0A817UK27_9BILA|nr:unnamed protein product [Rotaria socialis]CAF3195545.1 unnamed protein product [Rotaria socialis]CAF3332430.1 unnamed protein product [Rotaria socialis]CAF3432139.1 unnamed protein product [Rotaria socialis]